LRTAWVYGLEGANFVKTMLRLGAERELVRVVDDQRGSPTFADDLADGILALAAPQCTAIGVYHLAGRGIATWFDVAGEIFAETARRGLPTPRLEAITTAEYPTPAKRPANSVLDCSLLENEYGVALPDWRDGLKRMLKAHLDAAR
jgi:dTDP-4-dehydrorhamnose reductase